jgi:Ca2+-binding RTX toxin-like protein
MKAFFERLMGTGSHRHTQHKFRPSFDTLEKREVLSTASYAHGTLTIQGTEAADVIRVRQINNNMRVDGVKGVWAAGTVTKIVVNAKGGNDAVFLNSESIPGHQPLSAPCVVKAGAGADLVFGSFRNDTIFGGADTDTIYGRSGHDAIFGEAGSDKLFGDQGNDTITVGEFTDTIVRGGVGNDRIVFAPIDPSQINNDPELLKTTLNNSGLLEQLAFHYHDGNGHHVRVKNVKVSHVTIAAGQTKLEIRADYRYQDTRGLVQYSVSGSVRLSLRPVLQISLTETGVDSANITFKDLNVLEVTVNNVPNWADNIGFIRNKIAAELNGMAPVPVAGLVQAYLATGGTLGNAVA